MKRRNVKRVPISCLSFKKEYIKKIFKGLKTTTIRLGILVPKSKLVIYGNGEALGRVAVESVKYTKVKDLTDIDAVLDGFRNKEELKAALSKHYPGISGDDWVTIIRFRVIEKFNLSSQIEEIAKLALAYNVVKNRDDARILAAVATTGSINKAYELLNKKYSKSYIRKLLNNAKRELKRKLILKS